MANNAYLIPAPGKMPTAQEVDRVVREIVAQHFPPLVVEFSEEYSIWVISVVEEKTQIAFTFCLDSYYQEAEDGEDLAMKILPCIEFRHGHSFDFLWWLEREFTLYLKEAFPGKTVDDGIGEYEIEPTHYSTYYEYLEAKYKDKPASFNFYTEDLKHQLGFFPSIANIIKAK